MVEETKKVYEQTKKSLDSLLREKAYSEVKEVLQSKGIDINDVSDTDIESLVAAKVEDMITAIKGFGVGAAFTITLSFLIGV